MQKLLLLAYAASSHAIMFQHALTGAYLALNGTGYYKNMILVKNPEPKDRVNFDVNAFESKYGRKFIGCANGTIVARPAFEMYASSGTNADVIFGFPDGHRYVQINKYYTSLASEKLTGNLLPSNKFDYCRGFAAAIFERPTIDLNSEILRDGNIVSINH
jgi:hypothetical protein